MNENRSKRLNSIGFTLVELLVAVTIIAILSVIGITIFATAQTNARDARRKADIDAIANALETNKGPGILYYERIDPSYFSNGRIPADTTTDKYCIATGTITTKPGPPTTWDATDTDACPTAPALNAGAGTSAYTEITGGTTVHTLTASTIYWRVCARLESQGSALTVYCKASSQQ